MAGPNAASLPIPDGMTKEQVEKLFQTFITQRVTGKARDEANRKAIKDLISAHKGEYDAMVAKYSKKA